MEKPFYEMTVVELINTSLPLLELQLQEGVAPGPAAHKILELATALFTARSTASRAIAVKDQEEEWWKTYRAALPGLTARRTKIFGPGDVVEDLHVSMEEAHLLAVALANTAHGSLQNTTPGL